MGIEKIELLLEQLTRYLNILNQPSNCWDILVTYWIPAIGGLVLIFSSIAAVVKYYLERKRAFAEKMLKEVYTPLFQYLVKQEFYRQSIKSAVIIDEDEHPFFNVGKKEQVKTYMISKSEGTTSSTNINEKKTLLGATDLIEVTKNENFGIAPQRLVTLLNMNHILDEVVDNVPNDESIKIQKKLKEEIIRGYKLYSNNVKTYDKEKHTHNIIRFGKDNIKFEDISD